MKKVSRQLARYREKRGIPVDLPVGYRRSVADLEFEHDGRKLTGREWCEILDIKLPTFRKRLRIYGPEDDRAFLTKKELKMKQLKEHAWPAAKKARADETLRGGYGNEEWKALEG